MNPAVANLFDDLLQALTHLAVVFPAALVASAVHEYTRARTAVKLGDPTPEDTERMTANPFSHVEYIGFLLMVLYHIGWSRPVPVNYNRLGWRKAIRINATAFVASIIVAAVCLGMYHIYNLTPASWFGRFFRASMEINMGLAI
ncbi:unnamed protein product, partial [marine sediment metagenome]